MHTNRGRTGERAQRVTGGIRDQDLHAGVRLRLGNAIRDLGALGRRVRHEPLVPVATARAAGGIRRLTECVCNARRKEVRRLRGDHRRHLLQRTDVHDIDRASMRARNQLVVTRMDLQVVHRHRGQAGHELLPARASIHRHERTDVGTKEQQVRVHGILPDHVHEIRTARRQRAREARERAAEIARRDDVRREVTATMVVVGDVERGRVVMRRLDPAHVGLDRHAGHAAGQLLPGRAVVAREPELAVIRTGVEQAWSHR